MAQTNLGMTHPFYTQQNMTNPSIVYEEVDNTPTIKVVTKQIWVDGQGWVPTKFYNIPNIGRISNVSELERWCMDTLGKPKYLSKWFKVSQTIVLDEKTYMLWLLVK